MHESDVHRELVRHMHTWISSNLLNPQSNPVCADSGFSSDYALTPEIGLSRPDIYIASGAMNPLILGEAKTSKDIERKHSIKQYIDYLCFLKLHGGSHFVLAVPWHHVPCARNTIRRIVDKCDAQVVYVHVLDNLPG